MSRMEAWRTHLRLCLLRALNESPGYEANESLLTAVVRQFGFGASRDQVSGELTWLAEAGLVTSEDIASLKVAKLAPRGIDVAEGIALHPGVARPAPKV